MTEKAKNKPKKKLTAMQEIHNLLKTKNAREVLDRITEQGQAIQQLITVRPILMTIAIHPVTGVPFISTPVFLNPKNDRKMLLVVLRQICDQLTADIIDLAEKGSEAAEAEAKDAPPAPPEMPPAPEMPPVP